MRTKTLRMFRAAKLAALVLVAAGAARGDELPITDVFSSGSEGYHTFRIPAVVATRQGTLLLFCEGRKTGRGDHGDIDLVVKRSTDGGKSWGPLELVHEEGGKEKITIGNPCPIVDRDTGVVWLPLTRDNDDVLITSSSDEGRTWSKPRLITTDVKKADWNWYATGPGNGIQLARGPHRGRLVAPCDHRVNGDNDWGHSGRSHVIYSDDHGQTWKLGGATDWAMNECAVAELADGQLMLNMRSYRKQGSRAVATSSDGGLTWSEPVDDATLIEPVCQGSLVRYSFAKGDQPGRLLFSNPASKEKRHRLTVRMSRDDGATWPVSKLVYPGSAAYSCLAVLPDGDVGLVYERDNYAKISFVRFDLDWLQSEP